MHLNMRRWGDGEKTALLIHGLYQDSTSWYRLGPSLAERGYRVLAPDLRGHGKGPRAERYTPTDWGLDLVDTCATEHIDLAIGHSLGGLALAVAAHALRPASIVYLDPAWRMSPGQDAEARAEWLSWLTWTSAEDMRPVLAQTWDEKDLELTWDALQRTDPAVVPGLANGSGYDFSAEWAGAPSLVIAADPSEFITTDHAHDLRQRGLTVETAHGTTHSWFREDYPAFLARIDHWIAEPTPARKG